MTHAEAITHRERAEKLIREPEPFHINGYLAGELQKFDAGEPGDWTLHRGRYEEALEEIKQAVSIDGEDKLSQEILANLLVTLGRYEEALPHYQKTAQFKESSAIHLNIAALYEKLGEPHKAFDHYRCAAQNEDLCILAAFLQAFSDSELTADPGLTLPRVRRWIEEYLDRDTPVKDNSPQATASPWQQLKNWLGIRPACPCCGDNKTIFFKTDAINHRQLRQCQNCKIIYVERPPDFQEIQSWYGDRYFEPSLEPAKKILALWQESLKQDNPGLIFHPTGKQFSLVFQWLESLGLKEFEQKLGNGKKMLDLGCATSGLMAEFITRGWKAQGVELSPSAVKFDQQMGFDVLQGTIEDAHFNPNSFDLITLTHVIEHLPDPLATLKEAARILKPSGKLFIRTPNAESLPRLLAGTPWFGDHDHLFFFGNRSLANLLEKCKFRVIGVKSYLGIDIETYRGYWDNHRLNDLIRARINRAEAGDVILIYAEYTGN
jgi:2-polyprenyl-3-methyl-5-hydroxy-6-metoxy-1,4-benzoquinol methylase